MLICLLRRQRPPNDRPLKMRRPRRWNGEALIFLKHGRK
jgi:hypothetical protein